MTGSPADGWEGQERMLRCEIPVNLPWIDDLLVPSTTPQRLRINVEIGADDLPYFRKGDVPLGVTLDLNHGHNALRQVRWVFYYFHRFFRLLPAGVFLTL